MADEKKRLITWGWNKEEFTLSATIERPKTTAEWKVKEFYPNVNWNKADDLEVGLMVNGLKQRLADKAAANKDSGLTPLERLNAMSELGKLLLEKRTYALGSSGGGLTSDQQWDRIVKEAVAQGIPQEMAENLASKLFPKAKQAQAQVEKEGESK